VHADVAQRFAKALATKDRDALLDVLTPDVEVMALTPRKFWEAGTATAFVDEIVLARWFEPHQEIEALEAVDTAEVEGRDRLTYRVRVRTPDGLFAVEQVAYFDVTDDRISWLRLLCSGYRPLRADA
jgi:hypothetical protein